MSTSVEIDTPSGNPGNASAPPAEVLFLDDEAHILSSLRRLFHKQSDLVCHFASSPVEALQILASTAIDVIVSDHRMPQMSGAEFLARVKEKRPNAIRMMLTGQADLAAVQKAINDGEIYRFLSKPWKDEELILAVRQAVAHQRLSAENQRLATLTFRQNQQLLQLNEKLEEQVNTRTSQLADALHTARTLNVQLQEALYTSTKTFFALIQLARPELGGHCRRVAEHAVAIGTALGFERDALRDLEIAALLHDGGKLNLPSFLVEKHPSDYSVEEFELYKSHPMAGTEYLRGSNHYEKVAAIILQHHERYDGSGFPSGLKGNAIMPEAYVVGIADEYERHMSRPDQNRDFIYQYTAQCLADCSDKLFPARIVQAALDYLEKVNHRQLTDDLQRVTLADLIPNTILARDIYTMSGTLLAAGGTSLTAQNLWRVRAISRIDPVAGEIIIHRRSRRGE